MKEWQIGAATLTALVAPMIGSAFLMRWLFGDQMVKHLMPYGIGMAAGLTAMVVSDVVLAMCLTRQARKRQEARQR